MPPGREVRLWMKRTLAERGLDESALLLTITDIREGKPDKGGRWLVVTTQHSEAWNQGRQAREFVFRKRP